MKPLEFNDKILWDMIDKLRDELNIARDGITDLNDVVKDLQAESIEQIKDNKKLESGRQEMYIDMDAEVRELQAKNKKLQAELQAVNDDYNNDHKVHNEYEDGLLAEIKELKAEESESMGWIEQYKLGAINYRKEIKELKAENMRLNAMHVKDKDGLYDEVKELQADNKRLVEQVSSNRGNSSSTHTHTLGSVKCSIAREIAEYMSHNDKCGGARLFLLPRDAFNDGEYDHTIFWEDGME